MYSSDKRRYIAEMYPNEYNSQRRILAAISILSDYEQEWGMDFTMQPSLDVLQAAFNACAGASYSTVSDTLSRCKKYARWRIDNGLPCADAIDQIEIDPSLAIRHTMVSSPEHLKRVLDAVFDDPASGTFDVVYRVFFWMGFSGIDDIEAVTVTDDEVDFRDMVIRHNGSVYPIYSESRYDFRVACDIGEFATKTGSMRRARGNQIMRGKVGIKARSPVDYVRSTIRPMLSRRFGAAEESSGSGGSPSDIGFGLTFDRTFLSGVFYRMYSEHDRFGDGVDFTSYAESSVGRTASGVERAFSNEKLRARQVNRKISSAKKDYENWKKAFGL